MRNVLITTISVVFLTILPETSWSLQNTGIINPAGRNRVPRGSARSGLIRSSVPPRPIRRFGPTLGSTTLDSFMRDSADSESRGNYSGTARSYFSQTGTITTARPGHSPVSSGISARSPRISDYRLAPQSGFDTLQKQRVNLPNQQTRPSNYLRPLRISPAELERLISDGVAVASRARKLVDKEDVAQMERLQRDLQQLKLKASNLRESLVIRDDSLRPLQKYIEEQDKKAIQQIKPEITEIMTEEQQQIELHEQLKQQLEELEKTLERQSIKRQLEEDRSTATKRKSQERSTYPGEETSKIATIKSLSELQGERQAELEAFFGEEAPSEGEKVSIRYDTYSEMAEEKFTQHLDTGEAYLKQGRYYQAVDSYTLASVYKPDEPAGYAGKSQALFAAGEYVSSALFLSRALELSPEQAKTKVNLIALFGSKEKLDKRIADVEDWRERSKASELDFLLGYIYYQTGKLDLAKKSIDSASEKNPDSKAIATVKKAIYEAR